MKETIESGFFSAQENSQYIFRSLIKAMATPGRIIGIKECCNYPEELSPTTAAIALTLFDHESRIFIENDQGCSKWIKFHCGSKIIEDYQHGDFLIFNSNKTNVSLDKLRIGTAEHPEKSSTIIIETPDFTSGSFFIATGPGIENENKFQAIALTSVWQKIVRSSKTLFPLGVDLIFTSSDGILCLPRTTHIRSI